VPFDDNAVKLLESTTSNFFALASNTLNTAPVTSTAFLISRLLLAAFAAALIEIAFSDVLLAL